MELLYFRGYDPEHRFELWNSDGTAAGTKLVRDQSPGVASSKLNDFVALGDQLLFTKNGNLMRSNGRPSGTVQLADFLPNALDDVSQLEKVGTRFTLGKSQRNGLQTVQVDGTPEGTVPLQLAKGKFNQLTQDWR